MHARICLGQQLTIIVPFKSAETWTEKQGWSGRGPFRSHVLLGRRGQTRWRFVVGSGISRRCKRLLVEMVVHAVVLSELVKLGPRAELEAGEEALVAEVGACVTFPAPAYGNR